MNTILINIIKERSSALQPKPTNVEPNLQSIPSIKVVLFDVYGTMFISASGDVGSAQESHKSEAIAQAYEEIGINNPSEDLYVRTSSLLLEIIKDIHAEGKKRGIQHPEVEIRDVWWRVFSKLEQLGIYDFSLDDKDVDIFAVTYELCSNPTWPMPNCKEIITSLQNSGFRLGIVSNAQFYTPLLFPAYFDQTVNELGFEPPLCAWSYQFAEAKPSTALFQNILNTLSRENIAPHEVVYIGNDKLNDIKSAKEAGLKTVLFAGDSRSLRLRSDWQECRNISPDAVITDLSQLNTVFSG
ncbi:MAG: HAD family hydrolase [Spirochaetia bacterium]